MKVIYGKYDIQIIPESDQDEVYLESVLNLHKMGDKAKATRIASMGMDDVWAYLEIKKQ